MTYFIVKFTHFIKFISITLLTLITIALVSTFIFDYFFLNAPKSKKLQEYCINTDISNMFINDIRKDLQNYNFYGFRTENNDKEKTSFFKATSKNYDFARCEVTYEKNSGKVTRMYFNSD